MLFFGVVVGVFGAGWLRTRISNADINNGTGASAMVNAAFESVANEEEEVEEEVADHAAKAAANRSSDEVLYTEVDVGATKKRERNQAAAAVDHAAKAAASASADDTLYADLDMSNSPEPSTTTSKSEGAPKSTTAEPKPHTKDGAGEGDGYLAVAAEEERFDGFDSQQPGTSL